MIRLKAFGLTLFVVFGVNFILNCAYFGLDEVIGEKGEGLIFLGIFIMSVYLLYRFIYETLYHKSRDW